MYIMSTHFTKSKGQKHRLVLDGKRKAGSPYLWRTACLLLCAVFVVLGVISAKSAAMVPGRYTAKRSIRSGSSGSDKRDNILGMKDIADAGGVYRAVYCIDKSKGFDNDGMYNVSLDSSSAVWGSYRNAILYIVENGYQGTLTNAASGSALTGGRNTRGLPDEDAYIATQLAIWHFTDNYPSPADLGSFSPGIIAMYNDLITEAASAPATPALSDIADAEVYIIFESDGEYSVSSGFFGPVTVKLECIGLPYYNDIDYKSIPIDVTAASPGTLRDAEQKLLGNGTTATLHDGDKFFIDLGASIPGGVIRLASGTATLNYEVKNAGFLLQSVAGSSNQALCGWGDFRVYSDLKVGEGLANCDVLAFSIGATKNITGVNPAEKIFTFKLTECNAAYVPLTGSDAYVVTTVSTGGDFKFPPVFIYPYNESDSSLLNQRYFTVSEVDDSGGSGDWTYDTTEHQVTVKFNKTGGVVNPIVEFGNGAGKITFTNAWKGGGGTTSTPAGSIEISKTLAGSYRDWGVDNNTEFKAYIKDVTNDVYVRLTGAGPQYDFKETGATGDLITFSAGKSAVVNNLPANVTYKVEEVIEEKAHYSAGGSLALAKPLEEGKTEEITVVNTYVHGTGYLIISKNLAGNFADWGVNASTIFTAKIKDVTNNNYLLFKETPESDGSYWCVGNDVDGLSEAYSGTPIKYIPFSAGKAAKVTNLWSGLKYEVQENPGAHYTTLYIGNNTTFPEGENRTVTVSNLFMHGTGKLVISKSLAGSYDSYGVGNSTEFKVKIWDETGKNFLLFKDVKESDGSYRCVGNEVDGLSETYTGKTVTELAVSAGRPLYLSNLWANCAYSVHEVSGGGSYSAGYIGNGGMLPGSGDAPEANITITVVNTYSSEPQPPDENKDKDPEPDASPDVSPDPNPSPDNTPDTIPGTDTGESGGGSGGDRQPGGAVTPGVDDRPGGSAPGGTDRSIPPNPTIPGRTIQPGEVDGVFIEFDDEGVPLGEWRWDDDELMWIYDEYPPMGELPVTGRVYIPYHLLMVAGIILVIYGAALRKYRSKRPKDFLNMSF